MEKNISDKIPAVLQQARKLAGYDLLTIGKNAIYGCFDVIQIAIEAAVASSSIEATAKSANADTIFYHLSKLSVENTENMLKVHVAMMVRHLKRRFGDRKFAVAIDYTDEMFYGDKETQGVVGTKNKNGSNYAFKYMTVNIVTAGCRFFLFSYPIFARGDNWFYIEKALDSLEELEIKTYVLLLDKEFNESGTLELLDARNYKYVIPADQDSKFERWKKAAEMLPAIIRGWKIADAETTLVLLEEDGHVYGYLTNLPEKFYRGDAYVLSELYSKRWGIETAHRVEDDFRIYTTTKNGFVRYFFFVISVLIYNLWVWVNLNFGAEPHARITVEELKQLLTKGFEDFWRWLSSPERWLSLHSFGNSKGAQFACFWLPAKSAGSIGALP
ncbi:MAG: transposase [Candidatus Micrarchaeota archaeon]|nr:transposase [Candidatus Micrarchaeota archaeon]